jgi:hypothetical protein
MAEQGEIQDTSYVIDDEFFQRHTLAPYHFTASSTLGRRIYVPQLAFILFSKEIPVYNKTKQEREIISGHIFLEAYRFGFDLGRKYFIHNFGIKTDTLYGSESNDYIRSLHVNFFHQHEYDRNFGWKHWITSYPDIISNKAAKDYGFYAGLISELKSLQSKHPKKFVGFDKCDESTEKIKPLKKPTKESFLSFKLKSEIRNRVEFKDIYDALKKGNLISNSTTLPNFKQIFSGNEVVNKIEWIGAISALHIFVSEVWKFQISGKGKWKTTLNCFTHEKGLTEKNLQNNKEAKPVDKATIKKATKYFTTT